MFIHSPLIKQLLSSKLCAMHFVMIVLIALRTVPSHNVFKGLAIITITKKCYYFLVIINYFLNSMKEA